MTRQEFLKLCGGGCLAVVAMTALGGVAKAAIKQPLQDEENKIAIEKSKFEKKKDDEVTYRTYIKISPEGLDFPIVVYRFDENDYAALLLQCTHRGAELNINGDTVSCPAHDSEFSNRGEVLNGPADEPLKTFAVTSDEQFIYVNLV
ncbi:Rieske (2Fe-2S) protein [Polluticoccus soli]|uniref:Rieske (2Fe-2S) protein n=1 Tax=Polluticoccus soli TaxID=3034150 RepID=UPI0023E1E08F|nr:Rieske (2Fe-2S) protein [Flavipsychrobacter sp. JY13-12]